MGKLKGIHSALSPDILHLLAITGHGDEIGNYVKSKMTLTSVLADINFPTHSICQGADRPKEYRADGVRIPELLTGILRLMPLDWYHPWQMAVMGMTAEDSARYDRNLAPIIETYETIANEEEGRVSESGEVLTVTVKEFERFQFYEKTKNVFAIIHTGETAAYANVILKRGVC